MSIKLESADTGKDAGFWCWQRQVGAYGLALSVIVFLLYKLAH